MPRDYAIGYGKPPVHSRFRKGRSGNPKGRPKGRANLKTDLLAELAETIVIREGDRQLRVSKQRALLKSLTAKGLKGDSRAAFVVLDLITRVLGVEDGDGEAAAPLSAQEEEQLAVLEARLLRRAPAPPGDPAISTQDGGPA
jgi:hypothetical protein